MEIITARVPDSCEIGIHGDTHEGNCDSSRPARDAFLQWVAEDRARRFVHMGDDIDAIVSDDRRYVWRDGDVALPLQCCASMVEAYRPVADRGLAWLDGNHPYALHRFGDVSRDLISGPLGIPYGGFACRVRLEDKHGLICKLYLAHPTTWSMPRGAKDPIQRKANRQAWLKNRLEPMASDCLVMCIGHVHALLVTPPTRKLVLTDDGERLHQGYLEGGDSAASYIEPDRRWYGAAGSFLRTFSEPGERPGYAERMGLPPTELGFLALRIEDRRVVDLREVVL